MTEDHPQFQYIAGAAGSGKTWLAKERVKNGLGRYIMTSTTGIAAINAGGTTINSALKFYDTDGPKGSLLEAYTKKWLHTRLKTAALLGIKRWVIDEVSMMDGRQLTILMNAIFEVNGDIFDGYKPADQLGLTLVGDFAQLPPVKAPFAFESGAWSEFEPNTLTLTEIHRQADPEFIAALRLARRGEGDKALAYFAQFIHDEVDEEYMGPTIVATNAEVDEINSRKLDELPGTMEYWDTQRAGKARGEWKNIPDILELKPGALVMVLSNLHFKGQLQYVNGDLGIYEGEGEAPDPAHPGSYIPAAMVSLERTGETVGVIPVMRQNFMRRGEHGAEPLYPESTEAPRPALDEDGEQPKIELPNHVLVGWVDYLPLRLAYASTVHKTQGLSLDKVQIDISDRFFGNPGSLYVALSRARTSAGIRLVGSPNLFVGRCKADQRVKRFL